MKHCPKCSLNWNVNEKQICPCCECPLVEGAASTANSDEMMEAFQVTFLGQKYVNQNIRDIADELVEMDVGDKAVIERVRISRKEYEALPEFEGF